MRKMCSELYSVPVSVCDLRHNPEFYNCCHIDYCAVLEGYRVACFLFVCFVSSLLYLTRMGSTPKTLFTKSPR